MSLYVWDKCSSWEKHFCFIHSFHKHRLKLIQRAVIECCSEGTVVLWEAPAITQSELKSPADTRQVVAQGPQKQLVQGLFCAPSRVKTGGHWVLLFTFQARQGHSERLYANALQHLEPDRWCHAAGGEGGAGRGLWDNRLVWSDRGIILSQIWPISDCPAVKFLCSGFLTYSCRNIHLLSYCHLETVLCFSIFNTVA